MNNLNIQAEIKQNAPHTIAAETLDDDAKRKVLHLLRDRLRRITWQKVRMQSQTMQLLEDMDY